MMSDPILENLRHFAEDSEHKTVAVCTSDGRSSCGVFVAVHVLEAAIAEISRLRLAIRSLADQDATLSACEGSVTVTMDATLTDAERAAIEWAARAADPDYTGHTATLRGLLERTG